MRPGAGHKEVGAASVLVDWGHVTVVAAFLLVQLSGRQVAPRDPGESITRRL